MILALAVSPLPVSAGPWREPPEGTDPWLETINWWRSFGGATDGTPLPPLVGSAALNLGPQNFVDYLMYLRTVGSSYCLHWEDPAHPRQPGVNYDHNGLVCMQGRLADAIEAWMRVPYHAGGLSPLLEGVGAAKATTGVNGAMAILYDHFDTLPPSVTNKTFVWPAPGGYMPRRSWGGGEWPRSSSGWWPSPQRRFVSVSAVDSAGAVPMCQPLITDFSLRPYGQAAAVAGTVVEDAILFPQRAWAVGPASVTYVTTALDGTDRRTLSWSFEVLRPPPAPNNVRVAWSGVDTYRLLWDPPTGGSPVTVSGYVAQGNERDASDNTIRYVRERIPTSSRNFDFSASWAEVSATAVSGVGESVFTSVPYWGPLRGDERDGGLVLGDTGLPAGTAAVLTNTTLANSTWLTEGYASADRCSRLGDGEQSFSNGNFSYMDVANLAVVELDPDASFCVYVSDATSVVLDVQGAFSPTGPLEFSTRPPRRLIDTRSGPRPERGSIVRVETGLPAGEVSALVNLTMTGAETMGCITADRCSNMVRGEQSKSNGNFEGNTEVANLAVVPLDSDGSFCIHSSGSWDVIVDLQGVFSTGGSLGFTPIAPRRIADTREWMGPDWWNDIRFWGWAPGQGPDDLDFEFQSTDVEPDTRSTSGTR